MDNPTISEKQKEILDFLYSLRYLHTNHFQKLFNHKDKTTVKEWLKDLRDNGYINKVIIEEDSFIDRTKPNIYCLTKLARRQLKQKEKYSKKVLNKVYREKTRTAKFINHCLFIADVYLLLRDRKEPDQELEFFTENELNEYEYFPQPLPSAYLTITTGEDTHRYFLEIFDQYTPSFVLRNRVKKYLDYATSGDWEANTNSEPLPSVLFICPTSKNKSHIFFYAKAKFEEAFEETFDLYLTTWKLLKSDSQDIWEKVAI
jgi:protein involved in plasmid replication-relaxation